MGLAGLGEGGVEEGVAVPAAAGDGSGEGGEGWVTLGLPGEVMPSDEDFVGGAFEGAAEDGAGWGEAGVAGGG